MNAFAMRIGERVFRLSLRRYVAPVHGRRVGNGQTDAAALT